MTYPTISLYLPTFNQPELLRQFLDNISSVYSPYFELKIIIIDASTNFLSSPPYSSSDKCHITYMRVSPHTMWGHSINISVSHFKNYPSNYYAIANIDTFHPLQNGKKLSDIILTIKPEYILSSVHLLESTSFPSSTLRQNTLGIPFADNSLRLDTGSCYHRPSASFLPNARYSPRSICETVFLSFRSDLIRTLPDQPIPPACPHYFSDYYFTGTVAKRHCLSYVSEPHINVIRYPNPPPPSDRLHNNTSYRLSPSYFPAYCASIMLLGVNLFNPRTLFILVLRTLIFIRDFLVALFRSKPFLL